MIARIIGTTESNILHYPWSPTDTSKVALIFAITHSLVAKFRKKHIHHGTSQLPTAFILFLFDFRTQGKKWPCNIHVNGRP